MQVWAFVLFKAASACEYSLMGANKAYVEHPHFEKWILDFARIHFLAADSAVAVEQADPNFRKGCFPAAVGSAVVAVDLYLRRNRQKDHLLAEAAAVGFEIDHHPAAAVAAAAG